MAEDVNSSRVQAEAAEQQRRDQLDMASRPAGAMVGEPVPCDYPLVPDSSGQLAPRDEGPSDVSAPEMPV